MRTSFLGNKSRTIKKSGRNLLDAITRPKENINHGTDIWNVYDFMYLDKNKIPALNVLEISIPSKSDFMIESKSMKLYLNSFYNKSFKSKTEIIKKIRKDIQSKIKTDIKVKFINSFSKEPRFFDLNNSKLRIVQVKESWFFTKRVNKFNFDISFYF